MVPYRIRLPFGSEEGLTVRIIGWPPSGAAKWISGSDNDRLTEDNDVTLGTTVDSITGMYK